MRAAPLTILETTPGRSATAAETEHRLRLEDGRTLVVRHIGEVLAELRS